MRAATSGRQKTTVVVRTQATPQATYSALIQQASELAAGQVLSLNRGQLEHLSDIVPHLPRAAGIALPVKATDQQRTNLLALINKNGSKVFYALGKGDSGKQTLLANQINASSGFFISRSAAQGGRSIAVRLLEESAMDGSKSINIQLDQEMKPNHAKSVMKAMAPNHVVMIMAGTPQALLMAIVGSMQANTFVEFGHGLKLEYLAQAAAILNEDTVVKVDRSLDEYEISAICKNVPAHAFITPDVGMQLDQFKLLISSMQDGALYLDPDTDVDYIEAALAEIKPGVKILLHSETELKLAQAIYNSVGNKKQIDDCLLSDTVKTGLVIKPQSSPREEKALAESKASNIEVVDSSRILFPPSIAKAEVAQFIENHIAVNQTLRISPQCDDNAVIVALKLMPEGSFVEFSSDYSASQLEAFAKVISNGVTVEIGGQMVAEKAEAIAANLPKHAFLTIQPSYSSSGSQRVIASMKQCGYYIHPQTNLAVLQSSLPSLADKPDVSICFHPDSSKKLLEVVALSAPQQTEFDASLVRGQSKKTAIKVIRALCAKIAQLDEGGYLKITKKEKAYLRKMAHLMPPFITLEINPFWREDFAAQVTQELKEVGSSVLLKQGASKEQIEAVCQTLPANRTIAFEPSIECKHIHHGVQKLGCNSFVYIEAGTDLTLAETIIGSIAEGAGVFVYFDSGVDEQVVAAVSHLLPGNVVEINANASLQVVSAIAASVQQGVHVRFNQYLSGDKQKALVKRLAHGGLYLDPNVPILDGNGDVNSASIQTLVPLMHHNLIEHSRYAFHSDHTADDKQAMADLFASEKAARRDAFAHEQLESLSVFASKKRKRGDVDDSKEAHLPEKNNGDEGREKKQRVESFSLPEVEVTTPTRANPDRLKTPEERVGLAALLSLFEPQSGQGADTMGIVDEIVTQGLASR